MHVETVFGKDFTLQNIYISDVRRDRKSTVCPIFFLKHVFYSVLTFSITLLYTFYDGIHRLCFRNLFLRCVPLYLSGLDLRSIM
jgi:hypothetical protein